MSKYGRSKLCKHLGCAAMFFLLGSVLALASVSSNISLEKLSKKELAAMLLMEANPSEAFFELWRRKRPGKWKDIEQFESANSIADVRVCPLGEGKKHGYLVLKEWEPYQDLGVYTASDVERLFPRKKGYLRRVTAPFELISAEGETIQRGDMVSDGFLEDINGDGFIECVDARNGGFQGLETGRVLAVSVVGEDRKCIFKVIYDWEFEDETSQADPWSEDFPEEGSELERQAWWFDVSDHDRDGCCEIEIGPKTPYGVDCEVIFSWDASKGTYVSKQGTDGEHFHVLDPEKTRPDISKLLDKGRVEMEKKKLEAQKEKEAREARKYRYRSLKGLTDEEILEYMGGPVWDMEFDGGDEDDKTKVPEGFWKLSPKKAAYELAEINRSEGHKRTYRLAVDDLDGRQAPAICSISLDYSERYPPTQQFFLRCDPRNSYYVFTAWENWWPGRGCYGRNVYRLGLVRLKYDEARHMADSIWWLSRIRSFRPDRDVMASSTTSWSVSAGSLATVRFFAANTVDSFREWGSVRFVECAPEDWIGDYSREVFLNLATYVIDATWNDHVRRICGTFESNVGFYSDLREENKEKRKFEAFDTNARHVLQLVSSAEDRISFEIAKVALEFAEDQGGPEYVRLLKDLLQRLPEIQKDLHDGKKETADIVESAVHRPDQLADGAKEDEVPEEMKRLWEFRERVEQSLQRIQDSGNPRLLEKMAREGPWWSEGSLWALGELKRSYTEKYLDIIEDRLEEDAVNPFSRIFEEIAKVSPQRARRIAAEFPDGSMKPLARPILRFLAEEPVGTVKNEAEIVKLALQITEDPSVSAHDQAFLIGALVPYGNPRRFESEEIDEMLVRSLDKEAEREGDAYRLARACEALARRGNGARYLPKFVALLDTNGHMASSKYAGDLISAATLVSHTAEKADRRLLSEALRMAHVHRRREAENVIWAIWEADFRELKKELEQIATAGVDDEEPEEGQEPGLLWKISGRYHLARKIVSIWNEEDRTTKAKLLIALAFELDFNDFGTREGFNRAKTELDHASKHLTSAQRSDVLSFLSFCGKEYEQETREDQWVLGLSDIIRPIVAKKDASR